MTTIKTAFDAGREKHYAELNAEHRNAVKQARAKVRHWTKQVQKYDGEAHRRVLAKFEAQLAELLK
jgi:hypothetical protein